MSLQVQKQVLPLECIPLGIFGDRLYVDQCKRAFKNTWLHVQRRE